MSDNPFEFERDPKKFLQKLEIERNAIQEEDEEVKKVPRTQQLYLASNKANRFGLLAKLEDQTTKLAQERDEMFAREAKSKNPNKQPDVIAMHLKHFNPKLLEQKEQEMQKKNYRIRAILREKRETLIEFIERKRDICLANLNIITKKEETNRLEDFIKNEQESLRARKLYFKNDCELVKKFMNEVKAQADQATALADKESKKKDDAKSEVAKILAMIDRFKLQKTKFLEEYERLDKYRQFLEKIKNTYKSKFIDFDLGVQLPQQEGLNPFFVTGVDLNLLEQKKLTPEQQKAIEQQDQMANVVIEILNNIEEGNLRNIQNQRDSEEEIEQKKRELESMEHILQQNKKENQERLKVLEKQYQMHQQYQNQLKKQDKVDQTKLQFAEGEDLDMEKTGKKIIEIWNDTIRKESEPIKQKVQIDSKLIKSVMNIIEKAVIELSENKIHFSQKSKSEFLEAEKRIKQQKKEQRQNNQKDEEKKKQIIERRRKKEEYLQQFYKGRHDMKRNYKEEKIVEEQIETETDLNDDEKYLMEDYELVYVPPPQSKPILQTQGKTTKTISQSTHSLIKSKQIQQIGRKNSSSSQRSANKSIKSNTQNSEYVDIAYSQQIKKVRKLSINSLSSTSSLEQSFQKMEQRMKKNRTPTPEMIDQKYMISGYLQMSKDYKNLILTLRSFLQTLRGVLQYGTSKVKEDKILEVDQFFEKHSVILRTKVTDYFKIKESLHRFIRMKIQEPYYRRVVKKIKQIEKTNSIFELFRIYLEAFDFIKFKGFDYFTEDLDLMKQLQKPPNNNKIGQNFNEQINSIRKQIECTKDFKEGDILSKVFEYKINQILEWEQLLIRLMSFRYLFNAKYNLNGGTNSRKIIKSKKLYEALIQQQEDINKFLVDNFAMNQIYLDQLSELQDDLGLMKNQIIQWNIKLKNDTYYVKILQIVKFNLLLKKSLQQINNIIQIQNTKQYNQKYKIKATDIVVQIKIEHQKIKELLQYYGKSKEIEQDEYLQKQYNKSIIQFNYFMDLKADLEQ